MKFETAQQKMESYEQKINQLNEYIRNKYETELNKAVAELGQLKAEKRDLELKLISERDQTDKLRLEGEARQAELNLRVKGFVSDIEALRQAVAKHEAERLSYEENKAKIERLLNENEILTKINDKLLGGSNSLHSKKELERISKENRIFMTELKDNENEIAGLKFSLDALKKENDKLRKGATKAQSEKMNEFTVQYIQNIDKLQGQVATLSQNDKDYKEYIAALQEKTQKQESILNTQTQLIEELKLSTQDGSKLIADNEQLKSKLKQAEKKLIDITAMFDSYDQNFMELSHKLETLGHQNDELTKENLMLRNTGIKSEDTELRFGMKIKELERKLAEKEKEVHFEFEKTTNKFEQTVRALLKENEDVHKDNLEIKSKLKKIKVGLLGKEEEAEGDEQGDGRKV